MASHSDRLTDTYLHKESVQLIEGLEVWLSPTSNGKSEWDYTFKHADIYNFPMVHHMMYTDYRYIGVHTWPNHGYNSLEFIPSCSVLVATVASSAYTNTHMCASLHWPQNKSCVSPCQVFKVWNCVCNLRRVPATNTVCHNNSKITHGNTTSHTMTWHCT